MTGVAARPSRKAGLDRDEVVAAAVDLVVREGAGALSMRRLAAVLDVGTPTIYWHVGGRDELVAAVVAAQAERLAERPVESTSAAGRVTEAAMHIFDGAVEHRAITSLAHQARLASLLLHQLEAVVVAELEAAGLSGEASAEALRAILLVVTGSLVMALGDHADDPPAGRPAALWAASAAAVSDEARTALRRDADVRALTERTVGAVVRHHLARAGSVRPDVLRRAPRPVPDRPALPVLRPPAANPTDRHPDRPPPRPPPRPTGPGPT